MHKEMRYILTYGLGKILSDRNFLRLKGLYLNGRLPELNHPLRINDKIMWLMLYNRNEQFHLLADKLRVRDYVRDKIGENYLVPLLNIYKSADEVDFESLPAKFILKMNHGSRWNIVCLDKSKLDWPIEKKKLEKWLKRDYYDHTKEWVYKGIEPCILREMFLEDEMQGLLPFDYKIHCFDGIPRVIQLFSEREKILKRNYFDTDWNVLKIGGKVPTSEREFKRPEKLEEMLEVSRRLSEGLIYCRVDLFSVKGRIYFGEITFYPDAGTSKFIPDRYNELFGSWINLEAAGFKGGASN